MTEEKKEDKLVLLSHLDGWKSCVGETKLFAAYPVIIYSISSEALK